MYPYCALVSIALAQCVLFAFLVLDSCWCFVLVFFRVVCYAKGVYFAMKPSQWPTDRARHPIDDRKHCTRSRLHETLIFYRCQSTKAFSRFCVLPLLTIVTVIVTVIIIVITTIWAFLVYVRAQGTRAAGDDAIRVST